MVKKERKEKMEDSNEGENGELFRIFQEQQMLRRALEEKLREEGQKGREKALKRKWNRLKSNFWKKALIRKLKDMQKLEHRLLELEEAELEQGE